MYNADLHSLTKGNFVPSKAAKADCRLSPGGTIHVTNLKVEIIDVLGIKRC